MCAFIRKKKKMMKLSKQLAALCDGLFVVMRFGSAHRAHRIGRGDREVCAKKRRLAF